jgi:hypothetical protein
VQKDSSIAQAQLRDYQLRVGSLFVHDHYLTELTALRDQLKADLSGFASADLDQQSETATLSERIKALMASHSRDANAEQMIERTSSRPAVAAAEEPVTARLKRRMEALPTTEPEMTERKAAEEFGTSVDLNTGKAERGRRSRAPYRHEGDFLVEELPVVPAVHPCRVSGSSASPSLSDDKQLG